MEDASNMVVAIDVTCWSVSKLIAEWRARYINILCPTDLLCWYEFSGGGMPSGGMRMTRSVE